MIRSLAAGLVLTAFLPLAARAQVHPEWIRSFDASATGIDDIYAVAVAPSGAICAVGKTGAPESLVLRYNPNGSLAWSRTFHLGAGYQNANFAVIDPSDESVYALGRADANGTQGTILKYDAQGNLLWSHVVNVGTPPTQFHRGILRPNGNIVVGGTNSDGLAMTEYDAQGNQLWTTSVPGGEYVTGLALDGAGNIVASGPWLFELSPESTKFGVAKISPSGTLLWTRRLSAGGVGLETASSLALDAVGAAYVVGRLFDASNAVEAALIKLDPAGNVLWTQTHRGTESPAEYYEEAWRAVTFAPNGNVRVAGVTANLGNETDVHVAEFTPAGQLVWQNEWNSPANGYDDTTLATTEPDGSMTVLARSAASNGYDPVVLRWNMDGSLRWADVDPLSIATSSGLYAAAVGPEGLRVFAGRTSATGSSVSDTLLAVGRDQARAFGFGDGSGGACPCGNLSSAGVGQGCLNSQGSGASLYDRGEAKLAADTLVLVSQGLLPSASAILLQGDAQVTPVSFGDGLLAIGGTLKRMYVTHAQGGTVSFPAPGDPSISARSAALGDALGTGTRRLYQVYYRDPNLTFCTAPLGASWNSSSALRVRWAQ